MLSQYRTRRRSPALPRYARSPLNLYHDTLGQYRTWGRRAAPGTPCARDLALLVRIPARARDAPAIKANQPESKPESKPRKRVCLEHSGPRQLGV
eukprot:3632093-Rhodomonas_salina.2